MLIDLLKGKPVLFFKRSLFTDCLKITEFFQIVIFSNEYARFGIEGCRARIKIIEILCSVFPIPYSSQTLKLLLHFVFGSDVSSINGITIQLVLIVDILPLYFLAHLLIFGIVVDHLPVHLRSITIPPISFHLPVHPNVLDNIITGNLFVAEFGPQLSWALSTLFPHVAHSSTVITSALTIAIGLKSLFATIVPFLQKAPWFKSWYLDEFPSPLRILRIPR